MTTQFPWSVAGFLVLGIALVLIALRQREIDAALFPIPVQYGPWAGLMLGLIMLGVLASATAWWVFPIALATALAVSELARLVPRPVRIALALLSAFGWPFVLLIATIGVPPNAG
jgi:hypothetical protein